MEKELDDVIEKFKEILTPYRTHSIGDPNICCNDHEKFFLLQMADKIKIVKSEMSDKEICIALVKSYYSLNLSEQTEVYFNSATLISKFVLDLSQKQRVNKLYLDITIGDIIVDGRNLSQTIREFILQGKMKKDNKWKPKKIEDLWL